MRAEQTRFSGDLLGEQVLSRLALGSRWGIIVEPSR